MCRWTHLEKTDDAWKVRSQHHFIELEEAVKKSVQEYSKLRGEGSLSFKSVVVFLCQTVE